MSKKNNVNPDYYKQRGRDRINEDIVAGKPAPTPPEPKARTARPGPPTTPGRGLRNREREKRA